MNTFLVHEGKAALLVAAFWLCWRLLLQRETLHRLNRVVLLGAAALSQLLPLCVLKVDKVVEVGPSDPLPAITPALSRTTAAPWWQTALLVLYLAGIAAVLLRSAFSVHRIIRLKKESVHQLLPDGTEVYVQESLDAPFSWMRWIFLPAGDLDSPAILAHEKAHVALGHSRDLLFVDLVTALQWFNPVVWMLRQDLRALHEYEADEAALRGGAHPRDYQYLLVRKAYAAAGYSVANSFSHSSLKGRITMMCKARSASRAAWKALYVLPLVALSLAATAQTRYTYLSRQEPEDEAAVPFTTAGHIRAAALTLPAYAFRVDGSETLFWLASKGFSFSGFDTDQITGIAVYEEEKAVERFGERVRNGLIIITVRNMDSLAGYSLDPQS